VNGQVNKPSDIDVFKFSAKEGDEIVGEVCARRLGSPLDSVVKLTDENGKQIAFNDDTDTKADGLNTHHADSYIRAKIPADGVYFVQISDSQQKGGEDFGYRLRISAPQPDFQVRAVPSQIMLRPGLSAPVTVYALRTDGFSNEIDIVLHDAPEGLTLRGGTIPANQDTVQVTLSAQAYGNFAPTNIQLEARAFARGNSLAHEVVPAEVMMQAFFYHHLVPSKNLQIAMAPRGLPREVKVLSSTPLNIPAGGTAKISVGLPMRKMDNRFEFELSAPPEGISIQKIVSTDGRADIVLQSDRAKAKTGLQGNLVLSAVMTQGNTKTKNKARNANARFSIGSLPAIPFQIVSNNESEK
jgi:hypothetical protein